MNNVEKKNRFGTLTVVFLVLFVIIYNQTFISNVIPTIMVQMNIDAVTAQWLSTGYMLVLGIINPLSAYFMRKFDYRKSFMLVIAFFGLGSLMCAVSHSFMPLLAGRLLQAVGGGIGIPFAMNVFVACYPPEQRGTAMGTLGFSWLMGPTIAPITSGLLMRYLNWNAIFVIFFVLTVVLGVAGWFVITIPNVNQMKEAKLDVPGFILAGLGLSGFTYGIGQSSSKGWGSPVVWVLIAAGILCLIVFCVRCTKLEEPLIEIRVFQDRHFSITMLVQLAVIIMNFATTLFLPMYLQNVRGMTPFMSGVILLPASVLGIILGYGAGKVYDKVGIKSMALIGTFIYAVTFVMYARITVTSPVWVVIVIQAISCIGNALLGMNLQSSLYETLDKRQIPSATALFNTLKSVAASIGPATLMLIMSSNMRKYMAGLSQDQLADPVNMAKASMHGMTAAFWVAAGLAAAAFVVSMFFKRGREIQKEEV